MTLITSFLSAPTSTQSSQASALSTRWPGHWQVGVVVCFILVGSYSDTNSGPYLVPCFLTPVVVFLTSSPISHTSSASMISMIRPTKLYQSDSTNGGPNCLLPQLSNSKVREKESELRSTVAFHQHGRCFTKIQRPAVAGASTSFTTTSHNVSPRNRLF